MTEVQFASLVVRGRPLSIEYQRVGEQGHAPTIVFLHEGLGSLRMWRDFPSRLCLALGCNGVIYSRPGYGDSAPLWPHGQWPPDFMHVEALEVLPRFLQAIGVGTDEVPVTLFGHSDGATIALLFCQSFPLFAARLFLEAPHVFVEAMTISSIAATKTRFDDPRVLDRLSKYHRSPAYVFDGWSSIWLDPRFMLWNIEADIAGFSTPTLVLQGVDDEYGSDEHVKRVLRCGKNVTIKMLTQCKHSPHLDQPAVTINAIQEFLAGKRAARLDHSVP